MSGWPKETLYSAGSEAGLTPSHTAASKPRRDGDGSVNSNATYRVVFWGQCARGFHRPDVVRAFAQRFKIANRQQLAQLFSGKVITLKKGLGETEANRYTSAIQMLGGICRKESERKDYFSETEFKQRNAVSFLDEDFDPDTLCLAPKDEFSTEY